MRRSISRALVHPALTGGSRFATSSSTSAIAKPSSQSSCCSKAAAASSRHRCSVAFFCASSLRWSVCSAAMRSRSSSNSRTTYDRLCSPRDSLNLSNARTATAFAIAPAAAPMLSVATALARPMASPTYVSDRSFAGLMSRITSSARSSRYCRRIVGADEALWAHQFVCVATFA